MDSRLVHNYVMYHAPFLFFTLDRSGRILEKNDYAIKLLGKKPASLSFQEVLVDFGGRFDLDEALHFSDPVLLNLAPPTGLPRSFYFNFLESGDTELILAFGHTDIEDLALMQDEITGLNQELSNLTRELHKKNAQLRQALDQVKKLKGIVPICMHCHKIRNDEEIWERLEAYISEHTEAELSHGICPECMEKYYPE